MAIHIPPGNSPPDLEYSPSAPDPNCHAAGGLTSGQGWSILDCARTLYRRKAPLLWITGLGLLAGLLATAIQPRMYRSHASIQIQGVNENFLNLRDIYPTAAPSADNAVYVQTQAEMLRQDALIDQVVKKLHLERPEDFQRASIGPHTALGLHALAPGGWTPIEEVKKNLQIVPSRGSSIIQIIFDSRDPQLSADVANTLAQAFIDQSIEARQRAAKQTYTSLSLELEDLRKGLVKSEAALGAYDRGSSGRRESILISGRSPAATSYSDLKRQLDSNRQFYEAISRRVDEARVASAVSQPNVHLVSAAQPAPHPHKPNLPLNLAVGAFGGLVLAVGYVMLREQTNSVLRVPGEAAACLTLPELGAIPKASHRKFPALPFGDVGLVAPPVERASLEQSSSGVSESFRATMASILSSGHNGDHPRVLVVTSSRPMEGKTTVVSNLGISLAAIGSKVLLIDGDLRRPQLHKVFDQANSWGLSDVLREKNAIEEIPLEVLVKRTTVPHLYLLPGGTSTDNIFALLWSARMARLMPRFRQEFDYVLMDAPPCLEFADARIMGRYAEKLLLVVRADYTEKRTAQAAVQRLLLDGIPVMGVIFNCWDPSNSDAYGYARCRQDLT
ncbi:MAG TPA: polysaccharide biosynthesis tyrosine autokinase [Bryobacteraceae bacterium]|nr:polysaccharide biosynthesis tyrosine autokinase [Bryobacteraceae bacterium]